MHPPLGGAQYCKCRNLAILLTEQLHTITHDMSAQWGNVIRLAGNLNPIPDKKNNCQFDFFTTVRSYLVADH